MQDIIDAGMLNLCNDWGQWAGNMGKGECCSGFDERFRQFITGKFSVSCRMVDLLLRLRGPSKWTGWHHYNPASSCASIKSVGIMYYVSSMLKLYLQIRFLFVGFFDSFLFRFRFAIILCLRFSPLKC